MAKFSVAAVGDFMLVQRIHPEDKSALASKELIADADVRFVNLEMQIHDFEVYPASESGGTWAAGRPAALDDLKWMGFNLLATATNHSLDYGQEGLKKTIEHLNARDFVYAGIGNNLTEASMPKYLDTPEGRVGFISTCSSGPNWNIASNPSGTNVGRPGMNMLRFDSVNYVSAEDMETLKAIVEKTYVNANTNLLTREGFLKPSKYYSVGNAKFDVGEPGTNTYCNARDLERIISYVKDARRQADTVLVSHHGHEMRGTDKQKAASFMHDYARACIDAGADAFLGHGPHILRGIEIYKGKPIFYSLGDFFLQNDSVECQPPEFYEKYGVDSFAPVSEAFAARSENDTKGLMLDRLALESVIVKFNIVDNVIKEVLLYPITLGLDKSRSRKGRPELADEENGTRILQEFQGLCDEYGTKIIIEKGLGKIIL